MVAGPVSIAGTKFSHSSHRSIALFDSWTDSLAVMTRSSGENGGS
jgi:hypothetical protein